MTKSFLLSLLCLFSIGISLHGQNTSWKENHRGNRYFSQSRYAEAVKCYDNALQIDTTDARAYFNRGDAYLAQKNIEQAMHDYAKAAHFEKDKTVKAMAYHNMGYVYQASANSQNEQARKQEALRQAIEYYKESLRNNPKDNGTRYNLALCQKQLKDSQQQQKQEKQQQQKQQPKPQSKPQQQKQKQEEKPQPKENKPDPQTQQLLNLSRQAEQQVRKHLNQQRIQRSAGGKNW